MARSKTSKKVDEILIVAPTTAEEYVQRGWSFYSSNQFEKAEADFRQALDLIPDQPDFLFAMGMNLAAAGKSQEAVGAFIHLLEVMEAQKNEQNAVRFHMLSRLAKGHINCIKTGEWGLGA